MEHNDHPTFETIELADLTSRVADFKERGYGFVQLCATTLEASCELLYTFSDPERTDPGLTGIIVEVPDGTHVPSITEWYPAAFVFENETHDLFGIDVEGINLDFEGEFYTVPVAYPMNPRAALAHEGGASGAGDEEAEHE